MHEASQKRDGISILTIPNNRLIANVLTDYHCLGVSNLATKTNLVLHLVQIIRAPADGVLL